MVRALQQKYRIDFAMFEYDTEKYIKFASPSQSKQIMPDVIEVREKLSAEQLHQEEEEEEEDDENTTLIKGEKK